ncbi:MAG: GIY-YIG nuclease family protein [Candidatus Moraniibacteriota bacterium]
MFKVYVIYNKEKDKIYIGQTSDLENRILRHNGELKNKKTSFTSKNNGSWKLIHEESFEIRQDAMKREKELKSCQGRKFVRNLIK